MKDLSKRPQTTQGTCSKIVKDIMGKRKFKRLQSTSVLHESNFIERNIDANEFFKELETERRSYLQDTGTYLQNSARERRSHL